MREASDHERAGFDSAGVSSEAPKSCTTSGLDLPAYGSSEKVWCILSPARPAPPPEGRRRAGLALTSPPHKPKALLAFLSFFGNYRTVGGIYARARPLRPPT